MCVYIYIYLHIYTYVYVYMCKYIYVYIYKHMYICVCVYMYYTYIYIYRQISGLTLVGSVRKVNWSMRVLTAARSTARCLRSVMRSVCFKSSSVQFTSLVWVVGLGVWVNPIVHVHGGNWQNGSRGGCGCGPLWLAYRSLNRSGYGSRD